MRRATGGGPRPWRLGVEGCDARTGAWRAIAALLPGRLRPHHGPAVAEAVRQIARRLTPPDRPTAAHARHAAAEACASPMRLAGSDTTEDRDSEGGKAKRMRPTADLPPTVPPEPDALLAALGAGLDPGDLRFIAEADYGQDAPAHLAALLAIVRDGRVPRPLAWEPREVLALTRWGEPGDASGHRCRAFACCALLRAYGDPENWDGLFGGNTTLIGLVDSLDALASPRLDRAAAGLLAWLIPRLPEGGSGEHAFFGLGLLWFALALDLPDPALVMLLDWTMDAEDAVAAPWRAELGAPLLDAWLLPTTPYDQRHAAWRALGARLPGRLRGHHGAAVADGVRLVAAMLAEGEGRR